MLVSTFTLGDLYLGINILLGGMLNIRGRVITLFDLKRRLGWSYKAIQSSTEAQGKKKQYNVIMKTHAEVLKINHELASTQCPWEDPVGLVVDQLGDVRDIVDDNILPPPANLSGISADFVHGVVEFKKNLLVILNVANVLGVGNPML
ncbi:MAG: chemotaxis protein CheW [Magnetococcus sp. DMHC-6]